MDINSLAGATPFTAQPPETPRDYMQRKPKEHLSARKLRPRSGGFGKETSTKTVTVGSSAPEKQQIPDIYKLPVAPAQEVNQTQEPKIASIRETQKRGKRDLYKRLGDERTEYNRAKENHITETYAKNRQIVESGRDIQKEEFAADWQGYFANHKYIEQAMSDGHIDDEELRQINNLHGMSRDEREEVLNRLEKKYGPVGMQFDNYGNEYVATNDPDWVDPEARQWPAPNGPSSKPGTPHTAVSGQSVASRPETPDHFEDDGGQHDALRKQVRGIGEQLAGEINQQRKYLEASRRDRRDLIPEGASSARNQYKLLMTPRNRNFLSHLGLDPEISKHLPTSREDISKLYTKLDRIGIGYVSTSRIYEHFRTSGMKISKSDAERLVQLCDTNSDGYVQKLDLVNALQKLQPMIGVEMCMPSAVARQNNMVKGILKETEEELAKRIVMEKPKLPQEVLDEVFTPRIGTRNLSRHLGRRQIDGANVIMPEKKSALYSGPEERFMTSHTLMCLQMTSDFHTPEQRERLRKKKKYFVKLDMMHEKAGALEFRARQRDAHFDGHETARIALKRQQLERYTKANLVGADLYDRMEAKHRNRLRVMSRSPHLQQTFDIFNKGDPSKQQQRLKDWDAGKIIDASRYEHD